VTTDMLATAEPILPGSVRAARYAVVFKAYAWDSFVHRQASRCADVAGIGDFFVSVDETNGSVGPIPFKRVLRTSNADLIASGLPNRFEKGSLLWWNPDYVHYQFRDRYPDYDYYVFVEYDAVILGNLASLVERVAVLGVDLVALPIPSAKQDWFWTIFHRQTYQLAELQGSLNCISVFSQRALALLGRRRREMANCEQTRYWPSSEVFIPTEIGRAGFKFLSIAEFGDVHGYDWSPPLLEDDLPAAAGVAFFHPVLDQTRYIAATLRQSVRLRGMINPHSEMWLKLARFPREAYLPLLVEATRYRLRRKFLERVVERLQRGRLRLCPKSLVKG